jgi:hypothetical protein
LLIRVRKLFCDEDDVTVFWRLAILRLDYTAIVVTFHFLWTVRYLCLIIHVPYVYGKRFSLHILIASPSYLVTR